jgi:ABC-type antimicrobial peptide transport system permease subunit
MVAFAGGLLGILLSLCFNNRMMNALLTNIGITDFPAAYTLVSLILPITVLTICFFVFAYFVSRRIKRVDTRSLISNN